MAKAKVSPRERKILELLNKKSESKAIKDLQALSDSCLNLNDSLLLKAVQPSSVQKRELTELVKEVTKYIHQVNNSLKDVTKIDDNILPGFEVKTYNREVVK